MRRMVLADDQPIDKLDLLRSPMNNVMATVAASLKELARYKALYGPLPDDDDKDTAKATIADISGSETE